MILPFSFWRVSGAAPVITSANYTQGDTLGGGQPIVLTGTWDVGSAVPRIDGVDLGAGTYTVDSATQITFTLPAHAAGAASITVRDAGGTSAPLSFEFWDPTVDPTCTVIYDSLHDAYTMAAGTWAARYSAAAGSGMGQGPAAATNTADDGAGAPLFDGDGSSQSGLASSGTATFADYLGAPVGTAQAGSIAIVASSSNTQAFVPGAPWTNPGLAICNSQTGATMGIAFGTNGGTQSIMAHLFDATNTEREAIAAVPLTGLHAIVSRWGVGTTSLDASVDGALADAGYDSVPAADGSNTSYTAAKIVLGEYNPATGPGYQTFAGTIKAFAILNAKASDTFVTKHYAWARQRFGVA